MIGQTISHYRITEKLGEGGMGVVYKAEDTKLDRTVALKFLARHLVSNTEVRKRFIREAKTAAALQHPNICTVHEIGEAKGHTFIAMACLEGRELADEIAEGPLAPDRAVHLAGQFAEGLAEAHSKGIAHRDIKPANLFVTTADRGVILDFGLAQLTWADSNLTREGTTLGTCAYMSPEQSSGAAVDARTDVWALGCVLYEMLSGEPPFRGHYEQAIIYSILNDDPEPLENVPPEIDAIVRRCLAKAPEERYPDGRALLEALQDRRASVHTTSGRATSKTSGVPRLAVLPFKTRSGDPELESFAEGLTEDVTNGLAQFRHLVVVTAGTVAGLQGGPTREVSEELGARFLIEGSVRTAGSRIRLSVQLVDAASGAHLWAERFDRDLSAHDIFETQDELTDRIVATVADPSGVLTRSLIALVRTKPSKSLSADECVLRMFDYWERSLPDEHAETRTALEQAVELEPNHASAIACLSVLYVDEFRHGYNARPDAPDRALNTAQRAVALDATNPLAYWALAIAHYYRHELGAFRPAADRAIALNPRDTNCVGLLSILIAFSGDWETGCSVVRKVMQLNPHHVGWLHFVFFYDHYRKGEYEQALAAAEQINMPGHYGESAVLASINGQLGRAEEAGKHLKRFTELAPDVARDPRTIFSRLVPADLAELVVDGLRKASQDVH